MENQEHIKMMSAQDNAHRIITEWKKRKLHDEEETKKRFESPGYKRVFKQLAKENEQRKKRNSAG